MKKTYPRILQIQAARWFLPSVLLLFFISLKAQKQVLSFEGYFYNIPHKAFLFNSDNTCDSLKLLDIRKQKPEPDQLICYWTEISPENGLILYERGGVALGIDSLLRFYSIDNMKSSPRPYYLGPSLNELIAGKTDILVEVDDTDPDSLKVYAVPLSQYRLGQMHRKGYKYLSFAYDVYEYSAKGELSPTTLSILNQGIYLIPEDGKIVDEFTLVIPVGEVNVPGTFSFYIYDLQGNILRMITDLRSEENKMYRENFTSGTYRFVVLFNGEIEVKRGMLYFKEPPKPE